MVIIVSHCAAILTHSPIDVTLDSFAVTVSVKGTVMVVIVWQMDLQLPVQSVRITTKVVSSSPAHGEVYSIQHYVIKFVSDLRKVFGFLQKYDILLKMALNTIITVSLTYICSTCLVTSIHDSKLSKI